MNWCSWDPPKSRPSMGTAPSHLLTPTPHDQATACTLGMNTGRDNGGGGHPKPWPLGHWLWGLPFSSEKKTQRPPPCPPLPNHALDCSSGVTAVPTAPHHCWFHFSEPGRTMNRPSQGCPRAFLSPATLSGGDCRVPCPEVPLPEQRGWAADMQGRRAAGHPSVKWRSFPGGSPAEFQQDA